MIFGQEPLEASLTWVTTGLGSTASEAVPPLKLAEGTSASHCTVTAGGQEMTGGVVSTPVPVSARSNGFSSLSLLAMWMAAVRTPSAPGEKVISKVVLVPGASVVVPGAPTENSPALAPSLEIVPKVRSLVPLFVMVKVTAALLAPTFTVPNPMLAAPLTRSVPTGCCTEISGATTVYWNTVARAEEEVGAPHEQGVPGPLAKISAPPPECHALTMYFTVVPPGCAGMTAFTTSTTGPPKVQL